MSINARIKEVRKAVGKNQTDFGEIVGLKQSSLGQIETGVRAASDRVILLICEKFNVSESWLRTGEGEMFVKSETFTLEEYAHSKGLSDLEIKLFKAYLEIPHEARMAFVEYFKAEFCAECRIDRELASYRRELEAEEKETVKSSVLPDAKEA